MRKVVLYVHTTYAIKVTVKKLLYWIKVEMQMNYNNYNAIYILIVKKRKQRHGTTPWNDLALADRRTCREKTRSCFAARVQLGGALSNRSREHRDNVAYAWNIYERFYCDRVPRGLVCACRYEEFDKWFALRRPCAASGVSAVSAPPDLMSFCESIWWLTLYKTANFSEGPMGKRDFLNTYFRFGIYTEMTGSKIINSYPTLARQVYTWIICLHLLIQ